MSKTYAATYLYGKYSEYEKELLEFLVRGEEIDKDIPEFADIEYEVKRRNISSALTRVLASKNVVLMTGEKSLPKPFKVFCAKDIKGPNKNKMKVFIDCTGVIGRDEETGRYTISNNQVDVFVSYLVSAMTNYIYYVDEKRFINNHNIVKTGAEAFAQLFTHVVDYITKITVDPSQRAKCMYLSAYYYLTTILGKDDTSSVTGEACKISGLSSREADILNLQMNKDSLLNIRFFVETVADLLRLNKLTLDVVVERWMWVYGTGTVFALELFPAFATMLSDSYVGAYINNQKTIEKIASKSMVQFTKALLTIGAESV